MGLKIGLGVFEYDFSAGLTMGGYSARGKPSEGVHDPISCRAVVVDNGKTRVLLIEADFVGLMKDRVYALKAEFEEKYNIPKELCMIAVIHSHSSVLNCNLFTHPSPGVVESVDQGIREAVAQAVGSVFDARVEAFKGEIEKVSFNRRDWDPLSEIVNNEAIAWKIFNSNNVLQGILYNYSCHPVVMGPENLQLSADWPYYAQQYLRSAFESPDLFVMYLQGTPGNLNPRNMPMNGKKIPNTFDDCKEIGDDVGCQLVQILKGSPVEGVFTEDPIEKVKGAVDEVLIPIDDEDKGEFFEEFAEVVKKDGENYIKSIIHAIGVGKMGILGLPGEIFSEIGLNLKKSSPFPLQMVVGYANDYIGYVGTKAVYEKGGYEMSMMSLSGEEGDIIESTAKSLIKLL